MKKSLMGRFILLLALLLIIGGLLYSCADEKAKTKPVISPVYSTSLNPDDRIIAEKAFNVFCEECQPLMGKYSEDIESIVISCHDIFSDGRCLDYRCDEYGWEKQIYLKIKLKDKQSVIPNELRSWGHTLHFYLGGPKNPGITTTKFPELCGVTKPTDGSDTYIPDPRLSFIKK